LAGYTGAQFNYENPTSLSFEPNDQFWANGITVGGLEEKLAQN
jgi:hypothetical protein